MVNTRRSESGSATQPHRTTRNSSKLEEVSTSSSVNDTDTERDSQDQEFDPDSSNGKRNVREQRRRFGYEDKPYPDHVLRANPKRIVRERRSVVVFSTSMGDDDDDEMLFDPNDSEEEMYAPRRGRSLCNRMTRVQRRTALSLRPISQKCYTDSHPLQYSDSEPRGVRRSKRKPKPYRSSSWLRDDQIHKVGYPNLNAGFTEEDSRDAEPEPIRPQRVTRHSEIKNSKYLYEYETMEPVNRRKRRKEEDTGETKEGDENRNKGRKVNGKEAVEEGQGEGESQEKSSSNGLKEETEEIVENGGEENKPEQQSSDSEEEHPVMSRLRTRNNRIIKANYSRRTRKKNLESSSSESEEEEKKYSLRNRTSKQTPKTMQTLVLRSREARNRRHFNRRSQNSSSSSDTSSSDVRRSKQPKQQHSKNEKMKSGGNKIQPIGPETVDTKIRFSSIGGLDSHVQCLKEMILLPMMYPEVFRQFQIQPPKGVLFHGPPGTGKTLIARALANECSFGAKKVSFFLRKGADLLSKWIGESERQLRLLFEQAAEMKPSIIFFDELDGLAPVRSSRQDQVHASIVSTLLALMDGLDNRGDVIVIGATNRIDAIDPALRRPGRFDRELFFPLPSRTEREEILTVHVAEWKPPPAKQLLSYLAENTVGYCGSDLRALCSEAVIQSFRRTYPQVYNSEFKLLLNPENVKVEKVDFMRAKSLLVPASQRIAQGLGRKLLPILEPILNECLNTAFQMLTESFPHGANVNLAKVKLTPNIKPAHLLITGDGSEHGQTLYLAPAILYKMEHIHAYLLDVTTLFQESGRSSEEACVQIFNEAKRNVPSIIYMPDINQWWQLVSDTVKAILINQLSQINPNVPILFLATADVTYKDLPYQVQNIFSEYRKEVFQLKPPNNQCRRMFFQPLIIEGSLKPPRFQRDRPKTPPALPRAPTPPPTPMSEEQAKKLYETEEHTLRELRIFLRDMCKKLANNKLFYIFTKPVDTEEVPDYTNIIKEPMDLETMMTKVDFHRYECAKDFLQDIELIVQNALEYNPAKSSVDKQIRHRACSLRDYAYTLIKTEMDSDFEEKCQDISKKRKARKACISKYLPPYINTAELDLKTEDDQGSGKTDSLENGAIKDEDKGEVTSNRTSSPHRRRKISCWSRGMLSTRKKKRMRPLDTSQESIEMNEKCSSGDESKENLPEVCTNDLPSAKRIASEEAVDAVKKRGSGEGTSTKISEKVSISKASKDSGSTGENEKAVGDTNTPLTINCDNNFVRTDSATPLQSPIRRFSVSDLLSPSELLEEPLDFDDVDQALNESSSGVGGGNKSVECSQHELDQVLENVVKITGGYSLLSLMDLYNQLNRVIKKFSRTHLRNKLPKELLKEILRFKKEGTPGGDGSSSQP